jgi:hypothetical protein
MRHFIQFHVAFAWDTLSWCIGACLTDRVTRQTSITNLHRYLWLTICHTSILIQQEQVSLGSIFTLGALGDCLCTLSTLISTLYALICSWKTQPSWVAFFLAFAFVQEWKTCLAACDTVLSATLTLQAAGVTQLTTLSFGIIIATEITFWDACPSL